MASKARFTLSLTYGDYEVLDGPSLDALKKFNPKQDCHEDAGTLDLMEPTRMSFTVSDGKRHMIEIRVTQLIDFDIDEGDVTILGWHQRSRVQIAYDFRARYGVLRRESFATRQ